MNDQWLRGTWSVLFYQVGSLCENTTLSSGSVHYNNYMGDSSLIYLSCIRMHYHCFPETLSKE